MDSRQLAAFFRQIPQSNQSARTLTDLAGSDATGQHIAALQGCALVLHMLGLVDFDPRTALIRARSQTARYALISLSCYLEDDLRVVDDWKTRGVRRQGEDPFQNGATLLYWLETQRQTLQETVTPSREERVAQVLIKRLNPQTGAHELLFQYDANADQYQFIGGRWRPGDSDLRETMIREIEEELEEGALVHGRDYTLQMVAQDVSPPLTLSPTFGALTAYDFTVYLMTGLQRDLVLQPEDRWVPVDQIRRGVVIEADGSECPFERTDIYETLDDLLPGGWEGLMSSFVSD